MRNPALNEKMRVVDLGVAVCIDAIIRNAESLQNDAITSEQANQHKAQIRQNAQTYKQAIDELLSVLDADGQQADIAKNPQNPTACHFPSRFKTFSHLAPLSLLEEKTLDDKLNLFHSLFSTFSTFPEIVQFLSLNGADRVSAEDVAEVYKVYGAYLSEQFSHLHRFTQEHYNAKGGSDE